jgi:hypothetical protein
MTSVLACPPSWSCCTEEETFGGFLGNRRVSSPLSTKEETVLACARRRPPATVVMAHAIARLMRLGARLGVSAPQETASGDRSSGGRGVIRLARLGALARVLLVGAGAVRTGP